MPHTLATARKTARGAARHSNASGVNEPLVYCTGRQHLCLCGLSVKRPSAHALRLNDEMLPNYHHRFKHQSGQIGNVSEVVKTGKN